MSAGDPPGDLVEADIDVLDDLNEVIEAHESVDWCSVPGIGVFEAAQFNQMMQEAADNLRSRQIDDAGDGPEPDVNDSR